MPPADTGVRVHGQDGKGGKVFAQTDETEIGKLR